MEIISKWALGVILVVVLVFLPLNTILTRDSMKELARGSERQNEALESINDNLSSRLAQLDEALQGNNDTLLSQLAQLDESLQTNSDTLSSQLAQLGETLQDNNDTLSSQLAQLGEALQDNNDTLSSQLAQLDEALGDINVELSSLQPRELQTKTLQVFVKAPPNAETLFYDADTWTPTRDIEIYHIYAYQPGEINVRWQFALLTTNPKSNVDDNIAEAFLTEGLIMAQSLTQGYTPAEINANRHDAENNVDFGSQNFIKIAAGTTLRVHFGCSNAGLTEVYPTAWFHIYYREVV